MSDRKGNPILALLRALNLSNDEATVYLELLRDPSTHLRLSRDIAMPRTRIYRVVEKLEKRGLIARRSDDRGTFLVAADPTSLENELIRYEASVTQQRLAYSKVVPLLKQLQNNTKESFAVRNYEGEAGMRQAIWHELKTKGELLSFGTGVIEDLVPNRRWSEKYRARSVEAGYKVRELTNEPTPPTFTAHQEYLDKQYRCRTIPASILPIGDNTIIYNDTVTTYYHRDNKRIAVEIISASYARMMRSLFEYSWQQGTDFS